MIPEEAQYQFGLVMNDVLNVIITPLWNYRGRLDRAIAGGLVAFERGYFDGVKMVWDWTKTPRKSIFADWDH